MAKTRLTPIKQKLTIPQLELIAVVLGKRLLEFVTHELGLEVDCRVIWTDSQCVLHWLRKEQAVTRFVDNRVRELRKMPDVNFKYTPTSENPADMPTRGCTVNTLSSSLLWWRGPPWLQQESSQWPMAPKFELPDISSTETLNTVANLVRQAPLLKIIDETRYNSLHKLLRVTAFVFRFISNLKRTANDRRLGNLLLEEVNCAPIWWIVVIQKEALADRIDDFSEQKKKSLRVFRDSKGILRCSGRIDLSDLPYDSKYPVLLPKAGHFTDLVIMSCHSRAMHVGVTNTLARVRQRFWIIQGRSAVKRVVRSCLICRRFDGGPFKLPDVPPLPKFRLEEAAAFTNTGVDFLGPLFIKQNDQSLRKVWVCIFTCAVTRAVHLEVTEDLTTEQFLFALRRFIALYGSPSLLVSDNGSQFQTASRLLRRWLTELQESDQIEHFLLPQGIQWKFITEMAPWMGGFYERLVALVKQALRKCLFGAHVTLTELNTVMAEIVAILNSRPLIYLGDDVAATPLTPAKLTCPLRREGFPLFLPAETDALFDQPGNAERITSHWRRLQGLVTNFWRSWRSEYMLSLRERHLCHKQRNTSTWEPRVGTVVHLKQDAPRAVWKLARIESLQTSFDGEIRTATVRLPNRKLIRRPIKLLYPFEFGVSTSDSDAPQIETTPDRNRFTRGASKSARLAWQNALADETDEEVLVSFL